MRGVSRCQRRPWETSAHLAKGSSRNFSAHWLRVFRRQQQLAAVIREANRGIRVQGGQNNAWHSRTDVERTWA